jgi:hypothetical protein
VQNVPSRFVLCGAALARIFVPKTVDDPIPHWLECLYKHVLAERNPYVIDDQVADKEMLKFQIFGFAYRRRVLLQAVKQRLARRCNILRESTFPSAFRNGLADIDGFAQIATGIAFCDRHTP